MDEYGLTKELYSNHRVIQRMEPVVRLSNDQNEVQEAKNKIEELIVEISRYEQTLSL